MRATFDEAAVAILSILDDGDWHRSTKEIHDPIRPWVQEHMFGKVKSRYKIEHRRVGGGLSPSAAASLENRKAPERDFS